MKYKAGDRVKIREDLEVGRLYNDCYFNSLMAEQMGKVVTIEGVVGCLYYIKELDYLWIEEMFSGLAEEPRNLIPLIAKELGVEIGEEFKIVEKPQENTYKLEYDGLKCKFSYFDYSYSSYLEELITGECTITKLPQKPILTEDEKAILRTLPKEYKWIARDDGGTLFIYSTKPNKECIVWDDRNAKFIGISVFNHLFQFIKWEDEKPYNIEELLKGE